MAVERVVILGAGFAGIAALRQLSRVGALGLAKITLIDKSAYHTYTPLLYEVASSFVDREEKSKFNIDSSPVQIKCSDIATRNHATFLQAEVRGIDLDKKKVLLKNQEIGFDYLVIALGSEANTMGIQGVKEHGFMLRSVDDALQIRHRLHQLLYKTERQPGRLFRIILAGGGPSGVELASELMMLLKNHICAGHIDQEAISITIVEGKSRLLSMLPKTISAWTLERLRKIGITVHRDACVKEVKMGEVIITPRPLKNGEKTEDLICDFRHESEITLPCEMFIWTAGVCGNSILTKFGLTTDKNGGRVRVGRSLEIEGKKNIFVIGDGAMVTTDSGESIPWTAQGAMTEGETVGTSITRRILGRPDHRAVPIKKYATVVTVGGKWAVVDLGILCWRGFFGWVGRKAADLEYFARVMPFSKAFKLWRKGLRIFGRND